MTNETIYTIGDYCAAFNICAGLFIAIVGVITGNTWQTAAGVFQLLLSSQYFMWRTEVSANIRLKSKLNELTTTK